MTIKEIEEKTGLSRSGIRFYEKEKLIIPQRNENNGYRDYSEEDLNEIKKIAYLRTLGITIEEIRRIMDGELALYEAVRKQGSMLDGQIADLTTAKKLCDAMLCNKNLSFEDLVVEQYVTNVKEHWDANRKIFKMDTVSFLFLWGSLTVWAVITVCSLLLAIGTFGTLPDQIPVQWSGSIVTNRVDRKFIFVYPVACIVIRFFLRPFLWRWVNRNFISSDIIVDYLVNFMCFVAVSVQMFTVLFVNDMVKHVTTVLFVDAAVLIGLLAAGWYKLAIRKE